MPARITSRLESDMVAMDRMSDRKLADGASITIYLYCALSCSISFLRFCDASSRAGLGTLFSATIIS